MRIYASHTKHFIENCERNQISERLRLGFEAAHDYTPGPSEIQSWKNSLRALAMVLGLTGLVDQGILLEYKLPKTSKRIDCVLCGYAADGQPVASIIELKQ